MNGEADTIAPLELLHRQASVFGAVVCLTTDRDARRDGRRLVTREPGAKLRHLIVVVPKRIGSLSRWDQLQQGTSLVSADVPDFVTVNEVASLLTEELQKLRERAA